MPDKTLFMEVGFDPQKIKLDGDNQNKSQCESIGDSKSTKSGSLETEKRKRHYRKYFTKDLEKEEEVMGKNPFMIEEIFRMAKANSGLFSFGGSSDPKDFKPVVVGKFKGLV